MANETTGFTVSNTRSMHAMRDDVTLPVSSGANDTTRWEDGCLQPHFQAPPADQLYLTKIVYTFLMPAVCVLGTLGASICIFIFTRRQMRSSLSIYLAGLSFFDLILLLMSLLIYPSMNLCLQEGNTGPMCHFFWRTSLATYPLSLMAQTASVWTCVAITVDRYLAVKYPLHKRIWCTPHRARIVLGCIAVLAVLYKLPSIFELALDECGRLIATELRNLPLYIIIYNTYGYLLLLLVFPFLAIIILNSIVVHAVRHINRRHRQMRLELLLTQRPCTRKNLSSSHETTDAAARKAYISRGTVSLRSSQQNTPRGDDSRCAQASQQNSNQQDDGKCTKMAIITILAFVLFNSPAGVNNVIEAFDIQVPGNAYRIPLGNLLVCVNSATNIAIYSIFGRRFRRLCAKIFCPCFGYNIPPPYFIFE